MLPVVGLIFLLLWLIFWQIVSLAQVLSPILRGFFMTFFTLALTGGLHLDGLMDTCDAIFSRRDRQTRLQILSDTHAGSFAVMGCVVVVLGKTLLFAELLTQGVSPVLVAVYSRLGMAVLLNTLPFAKSGGLAVMLGSLRRKRDNVFFVGMFAVMWVLGGKSLSVVFGVCLVLWGVVCVRIFGGITGDLLGAFVEISEAAMMLGLVISVWV